MSKVPKFLLGGINFKHNFLGLLTIQTALYGVAECGIKLAPLIFLGYGLNQAQTYYVQDRDEYLSESKSAERTPEVRRESF